MSFRCQACYQPQATRTKPTLVVTKVRKVLYQLTKPAQKRLGREFAEGREIMKEIAVCPACAEYRVVPMVMETKEVPLHA